MSYNDFTSTLTCRFCKSNYQVRNVREKVALCPNCKPYARQITKIHDLSSLTDEDRVRFYKKIRYG